MPATLHSRPICITRSPTTADNKLLLARGIDTMKKMVSNYQYGVGVTSSPPASNNTNVLVGTLPQSTTISVMG
ncbi:MAG: hypothetical protein H7319_04090 [Spirosoma sp.]|nr:hypothetical protein [Spirosoma sp.]